MNPDKATVELVKMAIRKSLPEIGLVYTPTCSWGGLSADKVNLMAIKIAAALPTPTDASGLAEVCIDALRDYRGFRHWHDGLDRERWQDVKVHISETLAQHREGKQGEDNYPCAECGCDRTKAEGGTTFTVCDDCWDKSSEGKQPELNSAKVICEHGVALWAVGRCQLCKPIGEGKQWSDEVPEEGLYDEIWKCFACDEMAPCTFICTTSNDGIGVTEEMDPRFRQRICPAKEGGVDKPTWVRLPNLQPPADKEG